MEGSEMKMREMIEKIKDFDIFLNVIYASAELNYDKRSLRFNDAIIAMMLNIIDKERVQEVFNKLKEEDVF